MTRPEELLRLAERVEQGSGEAEHWRKEAALWKERYAQARAEGERAGLERAAKWHEEQAQQLRHEADETMGVGRSPDFQRLNLAERHTADAQVLRALKVEGETP